MNQNRQLEANFRLLLGICYQSRRLYTLPRCLLTVPLLIFFNWIILWRQENFTIAKTKNYGSTFFVTAADTMDVVKNITHRPLTSNYNIQKTQA